MVIIKATAETLEGVLKNQKYATTKNIQLQNDELILIQQTINSLNQKQQKTIRWIMNYVETYPDIHNESDEIWGKHWNYIIKGKNLTPIESFNIVEIQVSSKRYDKAVTHCQVEDDDEIEILNWIGAIDLTENNQFDLAIEFNNDGYRNIDEIINSLNQKYSERPNYKSTISKYFNRPTVLRNAIIERDGSTCKICKSLGFVKKTGERYCELHHMIELNKNAPKTMQSWNILVLCPTCHKKMHYGKVNSEFLNPGWKIQIENDEYIIIN